MSSGAGRNGLDRDGWSALHAAARHGQADLVRYPKIKVNIPPDCKRLVICHLVDRGGESPLFK